MKPNISMSKRAVTNVVFVGLGGQGVIRASNILADVMFTSGWDVKKAEVHGMSQRGGIVTSDLRFGQDVLSPMVPAGEADFVVLLDQTAESRCASLLSPTGQLICLDDVEVERLPHKRCVNVALLGALSHYLPVSQSEWEAAIKRSFRPSLLDINLKAFNLGLRTRRVA